MTMQSISFSSYPDILRRGGRGMLVVLLGAMPWAVLSPATSPPSQWARLMHIAAMAVFAILAYAGFISLWGRVRVVLFVFGFSVLMEGLQHFSPVRTGSWEDVGFNAMGCLAGVGLSVAACWLAGVCTKTKITKF
ncbi:MAG: VanZ family protein [Desulfobacteraceae bacterium]|nr:VanZ family protein [Desulfobacteraceae bacterium]